MLWSLRLADLRCLAVHVGVNPDDVRTRSECVQAIYDMLKIEDDDVTAASAASAGETSPAAVEVFRGASSCVVDLIVNASQSSILDDYCGSGLKQDPGPSCVPSEL
jgi:hypothetical protein